MASVVNSLSWPWHSGFDSLLPIYQLNEFVNTLTEHLELSKRTANNSRQTVEILAKTVNLPPNIPRFVDRDPKDDAIVQTALSAKADYLVTADQEILKLKKVGNVAIITAAEFARILSWSPK